MKIVGISGQASSGKDTVAQRLVENHGYVQMAMADPIKRFGKEVFGFTDTQLWGPSEARNAHDMRYTFCELRSSNVKFGPGFSTRGLSKVCDGNWAVSAKALLEYGPEWLEEVLPNSDDPKKDMELLCFWFKTLGHLYPELSPRIMLQHLGTEWGRAAASEDIWVNCLLRNAVPVLKGHLYSQSCGIDMESLLPSPTGVVVSDIRFKNELNAIKDAGGKLIRICRPATDLAATKTGITSHPSEEEQKQFTDDMFDVIIMNNQLLEELLSSIDVIAETL
jgi:hypothetical protein